jgi:phosphatidylserine/phosphatidylglycerophosphate/cardiolipin synthase-like enzyme
MLKLQSIKSPWQTTFDEFVDSIQDSAIIAAPFITRDPVERLEGRLRLPESVQLDVLTNLDKNSLRDRAVDAGALSWLCGRVPGVTVRHLRYLHAKAYVADNHTAIVTSANLTRGGIWHNYELGVAITDPQAVSDISNDLREYGSFGIPVPADSLADLDDLADKVRRTKPDSDSDAEYDHLLSDIDAKLRELRNSTEEFFANPEATITAKFADALKYVLRRHGALSTIEIYPRVQELMPEWCDDNVDLILKGRIFPGDRDWKHNMRNSQQVLKRQGVLTLENGRWKLAQRRRCT